MITMKIEKNVSKITIELPRETWNRIHWVVRNDALFEAPEDLILHAITDLLETYKGSL